MAVTTAGGDDGALPPAHVGGVRQQGVQASGKVAAPQSLPPRGQLWQSLETSELDREEMPGFSDPLHLPGRDPDVHLPHWRGHRNVHPRPAGEHLLREVGPSLGRSSARRPWRSSGCAPVAVPAVGAGLRALAPAGRPAGKLGLLVHHSVHDQRQDPARELAGVVRTRSRAAGREASLGTIGITLSSRTSSSFHPLPEATTDCRRCPSSPLVQAVGSGHGPRSPPALTPRLCALPTRATRFSDVGPTVAVRLRGHGAEGTGSDGDARAAPCSIPSP